MLTTLFLCHRQSVRPREIVGEDGFVGPALLGQRFGTPLAQAHTVAVAFRRDEEAAVLIPDGEAGAPQPQSPPEAVPETVWPQTGQRDRIARSCQGRLTEPAFRRGRVGGDAQS